MQRLQEIQTYIAFDDPFAAIKVITRIRQSIEILADHPNLGRDWDGKTRALLVSGLRYRVHYQVNDAAGEIGIITIAHTSQLPPELG